MTLATLKRCWAICAITRLVLSPLVAATKTSARSIPASISASISSAVPTVNMPPASSQLVVEADVEQAVRLGALVEHGDGVALGEHVLGQRASRATASNDQYEHGLEITQGFADGEPVAVR